MWQEAHRMVTEANVKQANAEKQLKEALGKVGSTILGPTPRLCHRSDCAALKVHWVGTS